MNRREASALCLECGLCCNGVIFANVQLRPEEDAGRLRALGLQFPANRKSKAPGRKFTQPCAAFAGCKCNIYSKRPKYCREFECALLKSVKAGQTDFAKALRTIRSAHQSVAKVKRLLGELEDTNVSVALSIRFRKTKKRIESQPLDETRAEIFGELSLAVHDLNLLLARSFYPGS